MENKEIWKKNYRKVVKDGIKIAGSILLFILFLFLLVMSFINIYVHLGIK